MDLLVCKWGGGNAAHPRRGGCGPPPNPPAFVSVHRIPFAAREGFADLLFRESRVCTPDPPGLFEQSMLAVKSIMSLL